jgi:hypothetical protein
MIPAVVPLYQACATKSQGRVAFHTAQAIMTIRQMMFFSIAVIA